MSVRAACDEGGQHARTTYSPHLGPISAAARMARGEISLWDTFQDSVKRQPDAVAYVYEGKSWTFKQADLGESASRAVQ